MILPHIAEDDKFLLIVLLCGLLFGLAWWWNRRAKTWLERNERIEVVPKELEWLLRDRADNRRKPATNLRYSEEEFREMVAKALDEIPDEFDEEWKNVAVTVSTDWPSEAERKRMGVPEGHLLLGSYAGLARTTGFQSESASQHVVVIYQPAIEQLCGGDKERMQQQIRKTVLHELAHYLGMSHERMREIGL
jgi:predicted Zn-dependent protease with MMP-like domain